MRKIGVCAVLAAIGMMAAAGDAFAVTTVDCSTLSALLTAFASGGAENTTYSIINGPCTGGITITQDNITIKASSGTQTIQGGAAAGGRLYLLWGPATSFCRTSQLTPQPV